MRPEQDTGAADGDLVSVKKGRRVDAVSFNEGTICRAQIGSYNAGWGDAKFQVAAGNSRISDGNIGLGPAANDGDGFSKKPLLSVDVNDGVLG